MTEKSINRLILLGNGFDLAHQIKTSYNDFIKWYLIQAMEMAKFHRQYVDEPMTITYPEYDAMDYLSKHGLNTIPEFVDYFYKKGFFGMISGGDLKFQGWQTYRLSANYWCHNRKI